MASIVWLALSASLLPQGNADYNIKVSSVSSSTPAIAVAYDPAEGDTTITFNNDQYGSTFRAEFFRWDDYGESTIEGDLCKDDYYYYYYYYYDETAEALVRKIFARIFGVYDCPIPAGSYRVEKEFEVDGYGLEEFLPSGFSTAVLKITTYLPDEGYGTEAGNADYDITVVDITSESPGIKVANDEPDENDMKLIFEQSFENSMFEATVNEKDRVSGEVCGDYDDKNPKGHVRKILAEIIQVQECPVPMGSYPVKREIKIEGNGFDEVLPPGFGVGDLRIVTYHPDDDGTSKMAVTISAKISEVK